MNREGVIKDVRIELRICKLIRGYGTRIAEARGGGNAAIGRWDLGIFACLTSTLAGGAAGSVGGVGFTRHGRSSGSLGD